MLAAVAAVSVAVFVFPKGMSGEYKISSFIYDGTSLTKYASGSYIKVRGTDNNKASEMYIKYDDMHSTLSGYIDTVAEYSNYTKYRFTVTGNYGNFIGKMDYFFIYYYPKGDYLRVELGNGEIRFKK